MDDLKASPAIDLPTFDFGLGSPSTPTSPVGAKPSHRCSELGCGGKVVARGLCATHYQRLYRTGRTAPPPAKMAKVGECVVCRKELLLRYKKGTTCSTCYHRLRRRALQLGEADPDPTREERRLMRLAVKRVAGNVGGAALLGLPRAMGVETAAGWAEVARQAKATLVLLKAWPELEEARRAGKA